MVPVGVKLAAPKIRPEVMIRMEWIPLRANLIGDDQPAAPTVVVLIRIIWIHPCGHQGMAKSHLMAPGGVRLKMLRRVWTDPGGVKLRRKEWIPLRQHLPHGGLMPKRAPRKWKGRGKNDEVQASVQCPNFLKQKTCSTKRIVTMVPLSPNS